MKIVIVGGSTAGTLCALELRKMDKDIEITIIEKSEEMQYSPCAMPYVLSGEIKDINQIRLMSKNDYKDNDIEILNKRSVTKIDTKKRKVSLDDGSDKDFDKLVIATGSRPDVPPIEIEKDADVDTFKTLEELTKTLKMKGKNITMIGAGLIGVEVACSLAEKKKKVTLIEAQENILSTMFDPDMSEIIEEGMKTEGIEVLKSSSVSRITKDKVLIGDKGISSDHVIMATGFSPEISLAKDAGLKTGRGISVDSHMRTSYKDIFACGDCAEWEHMITKEMITSQLATTALEQAKVVANNILGKEEKVRPVLNTSISKAGKMFFGALGITSRDARTRKIDYVSARFSSFSTAEYYAKESRLIVKLIADMDGHIIGAQLISDQNIAGYLNMLSLAAGNRMKIDDIIEMETCYNPACNPLHDPVKTAAGILRKKMDIKSQRKS
ncbi:MAG: NAD(P)/FAD-dependent oxidoreductase [Candidatus Woesearchaeota archaeon]